MRLVSGASLSCFLVARKPPLAPTFTHCTQPRSHRFISSSTLSSKYPPRTALPSIKNTIETRSLLVSRSNGHIHDRSNSYCNITITYIWNSTLCACVDRDSAMEFVGVAKNFAARKRAIFLETPLLKS